MVLYLEKSVLKWLFFLKNEDEMLPLDPKAYGSIVIIGQSEFVDDACNGGGGSSKVTPLYTVPPVEGMQNVLQGLGSETKVSKFTVAKDLSNLEEAKSAAAEADMVIRNGWLGCL